MAPPTYIVDFEPPEKEKARLDKQHEGVVENFGYLIPPSISLENVNAVADVATGTG
jgi:hypothetical protein